MLLDDESQDYASVTLWSRQSFPLGVPGFFFCFSFCFCFWAHSTSPVGIHWPTTLHHLPTLSPTPCVADAAVPTLSTKNFPLPNVSLPCQYQGSLPGAFSGLQSENGKEIMPTVYPLPAHNQWQTGVDNSVDKYPIYLRAFSRITETGFTQHPRGSQLQQTQFLASCPCLPLPPVPCQHFWIIF